MTSVLSRVPIALGLLIVATCNVVLISCRRRGVIRVLRLLMGCGSSFGRFDCSWVKSTRRSARNWCVRVLALVVNRPVVSTNCGVLF